MQNLWWMSLSKRQQTGVIWGIFLALFKVTATPALAAWLAIAAGLVVGGSALGEDTIRVTTWNLEWFPSGKPTKSSPEVEQQRIEAAAKVIEVLNPDVLLLQEVRDWETCEKLAAAVKTLKYRVIVVSAFKEFGTVTWQQVAILAKQDAESAWSASWTSKSTVDPPRGYAFATFRFGGSLVGFYSVHLKSNLVRGGDVEKQAQLNILKRELAAGQLITHAGEMQKTFPYLRGFIVGGDFNTNRDQAEFVSERTLGIFTEGGFQNSFGSLPLERRVTHPGKGRYPDSTFDYLFTRSMKILAAPEISNSTVSDHFPVSIEAVLK